MEGGEVNCQVWACLPVGKEEIPRAGAVGAMGSLLDEMRHTGEPAGLSLPPCPQCGDALDPFGDHLVTCNRNGCTERHNLLRDEVANLCRFACVPHLIEQGPHGSDRTRPGDLLLPHWEAGRDLAVDFTISHPLGLTPGLH